MNSIAQSFQSLVEHLAIDKPGASPFDPKLLDENAAGASPGDRYAIQFTLNLWNSEQPWQCGPFDVIAALATWDEKRRDVFCQWARHPWWP